VRTDVRRAGRADIDAASVVLAAAFADYAWTRWTVDSEDHFERVRSLQRLAIDRVALPYGEVWASIDEDGDVVSVAVWMLPASVVPDSILSEIGVEQATLEGERHEPSVKAEALVSILRPTTPHYYLGAMGTRPDHQRRGHGAAVLAPVLSRADAENAQVFLETSTLENVHFYRGLGFVTVAEIEVPEGGPHVWAMARP
jgi:GNAT superfamily N-acetyltransferase